MHAAKKIALTNLRGSIACSKSQNSDSFVCAPGTAVYLYTHGIKYVLVNALFSYLHGLSFLVRVDTINW